MIYLENIKFKTQIGKITAIILGIICLCVMIILFFNIIQVKKYKATVEDEIKTYVQVGDNDEDFYAIYHKIIEVKISENNINKIFEIKISRRKKENLPEIGDEIIIIKNDNKKWIEFDPLWNSFKYILGIVISGFILFWGIIGKVKNKKIQIKH